jgi:molybdopterin converting factor subunit 1
LELSKINALCRVYCSFNAIICTQQVTPAIPRRLPAIEATGMKILLFGIAKDIAGAPFIQVDAPLDRVAALREHLYAQYPRLRELRSVMIAVNKVYATDDAALQPGDEIAVIPPVSGG